MPIHFGTDGWRAVISDTFTFHNLRLVGQAIADAVGSEHWLNSNTDLSNVDPHMMVVGYDIHGSYPTATRWIWRASWQRMDTKCCCRNLTHPRR
jgi:phosphomannomutase